MLLRRSCKTFDHLYVISSLEMLFFALNTSAKEKLLSLGCVICAQATLASRLSTRKGVGRFLAVRASHCLITIFYQPTRRPFLIFSGLVFHLHRFVGLMLEKAFVCWVTLKLETAR
jgi:hypothetical protein